MLVGRAAELAELEGILADLRVAEGRALILLGEAGIGKTALLDALAERAGDNFTVLRARGVESEAEIAFSGLSDLLSPVIEDLDALPAPQSRAMAAALALESAQPGDRLAVCVATRGLLNASAQRRPILVLVDDLHWLDASSRECVFYAARRAAGPVAFALAARQVVDEAGGGSELPSLRLGRLEDESSLALLAQAAPDLAPPVASALVAAAVGNPLALVELPATLSPAQRKGIAALDLPLAPGDRLYGEFTRRIEGLPNRARRALLVAAAYQGDDLTTTSAACPRARTDSALLAVAEAEGLVRIGAGRLAFGHPLIRGAAYHGATAGERRDAHRALAGVLHGERRAWHLAAAAVGPDEQVAAELERAAGAAAARRGFASATPALERAARLSPDPQAFARRMLAAGETAIAAGLPDRALAALVEASDASDDGVLRSRAQQLRGLAMLWSGSGEAAAELLLAEAKRTVAEDPLRAAAIFADASMANLAIGHCRRGLRLAERAAVLIGDAGDPLTRAHVLAVLSWALALRGRIPRARPVLDEVAQLTAAIDPLSPAAQSLPIAVNARLQTGEFERALAESSATCARAREAGALGALPIPLHVVADAAYRLGDWELADAASSEAHEAAKESRQANWALIIRARLAAAQGREQESRRAALTMLELAGSGGLAIAFPFARAALGFLELGLDRVKEAIAQLETTELLVGQTGLEEPTLIPWAQDLVEAYARANRPDDARRVLGTLARQAASSGTAVANAALERCRGMLEEDFDGTFEKALRLDDERPSPFERARTLLTFGRRLHRARRRAEARERLREALAGFERLGAASWAAQARNELRAAGARRRRGAPDNDLTTQERRVAAAVARGASNREIAAELFLAPKTIEFHLRQIYRKLGVTSRAHLVAMLARESTDEPPVGSSGLETSPGGKDPS